MNSPTKTQQLSENSSLPSSNSEISREELVRIERFIAAYNRIDDFLQAQLESPQTFRSAVDFWARRHPFWSDAETLRLFASLRNFLVHEKTQPFDYPCVPSESATREIEAALHRLTYPITLGEKFTREVVVLSPTDTLEKALRLVESRRVSRFPIFDDQRFAGLLTENGIAQFLAECVTRGQKFDAQTPIKKVLPRETRRPNFLFAHPQTPVAQAEFWFGENIFLEAILIAAHEGNRPTGIVTRGDLTGWSG